MSVLIDPYMFELSNEQEIRNNITFFMNIIKIASHSEKSKRVSIAVYRGMVKKNARSHNSTISYTAVNDSR